MVFLGGAYSWAVSLSLSKNDSIDLKELVLLSVCVDASFQVVFSVTLQLF